MSHPANEALADQCETKAINDLERLGITEDVIFSTKWSKVTYNDLIDIVAAQLYQYYMEREML